MEQTEVYIVIYGCNYDTDIILGAYTSYDYAKKAKKEFMESKECRYYDYIHIRTYKLNESVIMSDEEV